MNNVTIIDKNGNGILAEGISYITITSETASKNYIFYTLNETVENGLTKIYIAEIIDGAPVEVRISDEEWTNIKKIMVSILHSEDLSNVTFNKIEGNTFNISEPKKLAIDLVKKQTLLDVQNTKTLAAAQATLPSEPAAPGAFFNTEAVNSDGEAGQPVDEANVPNIFDNPLQPEAIPSTLGGIEDPTKVPINNVAENVVDIQENIVVEELDDMNQDVIPVSNDVVTAPLQNNKPSMEEVKNALDVLNRYFSEVQVEYANPAIQTIEPTPIAAPVFNEAPVAPVMPEVTPAPIISEIPASPVMPEVMQVPVTQSVTAAPVMPEVVPTQVVPETPASPAMPEVMQAPVTPASPVMPDAIVSSVAPTMPEVVQAPVFESAPLIPEIPAEPVSPVIPTQVPVEPVTPGVNSIPVQMPTSAVDPAMINTAGFEGLTVDSN